MRIRRFCKICAVTVLSTVLFMGCGSESGSSSSNAASGSSGISESSSEKGSESSSSDMSESSSSEAPESSSGSVPGSQSSSSDTAPADTKTPFEVHGALSVKGADLVDKDGNKFQLKGMSTHGIAWFPKYVNPDAFKTLRDDWNTNCVRLAMYTDENMGYCNGGNQEELKALVKNGVRYATELGMYVIVDWHILHDKTPLKFKDEAVKFFDEITKEFAGNDNVLYEICNEPNSGPSWTDVKTYAEEVIPVIRANDPNCVVLVGSPTWSQDIHKAAQDPLSFENVMYTLHFYAGTHKDSLRKRAQQCIDGGLPVFISEFGICDASGNGKLDYDSANAWKELIDKNNLSYMCWNLSNHQESSAVFVNGCDKLSGWAEADLKDQGKWVRDWFKSSPSL